MFKRPFSKRDSPQPDTLTYKIPSRVRTRIIHSLAEVVNACQGNLQQMFEDAGSTAMRRIGDLAAHQSIRQMADAAIEPQSGEVATRKCSKHTMRSGNYSDAIQWAGKSLESVLQIICDAKGWKFVPDKDTLNPLIQACYKGGLFAAPFQSSMAVIETVPRLRHRSMRNCQVMPASVARMPPIQPRTV